MTRYAVVDLEATDAHSSQNKIIQIGIALVEGGEVVDTYTTDVNPHESLLPRIASLTGLSDRRLSKAPDFSEVAEEVRQKLEGTIFVAHNARFDYSLLMKSLFPLGLDLELPRVDTVELARVVFPTFEKYGMEALSERLDLRHDQPHAALSDALATAELLLKMQDKIRELPRAVLEEIIRHSDSLLYETKEFLKEQLPYTSLKVEQLYVVHNIATRREKVKENRHPLANSFAKNISRLGLKVRKNQEKIAEKIKEELTQSRPSFIEAPTGIGKTYAYLLPLLAEGREIVVSTPTKVLQNQMIHGVAPILKEKFGVNFSKLLGTKNYISLEKFSRLLLANTEGKNFEIFKMKILVWLTETLTGELDELSKVMTNEEYFAQIAHDGYVNNKQLHYEQDFWLKAQRRAEISQVKVVNHAYLIERLADYPETFLQERVLVVDEAQQLFTTLERANQKSVKISEQLETVDTENSHLNKRLVESLTFQLKNKKLDSEKIALDARELGLKELAEIFEHPEQNFIWRDGDMVHASSTDFYNFEKLVPSGTKIYMLGATLSLTEDKPIFPELLGFKDYRFFKFESHPADNQEIFILSDGPHIKNTGVMAYAHYVADKVSEVAELGCQVVVLFTAKVSLTFVAEQLSAEGWDVLAQDINGTAAQIKKKFDKGEGQILLGLASFWEGVDFEKQDHLVLMIPRLPFATPDDVLTKKYAKRFNNPFYDFNVPMATLKLQQALGRVNRRHNQYSKVVILDNRLAGKSYAKRMRKNLAQTAPLKTLESREVVEKILEFLM
ncbi:helicase C-terminal domain-containing protein [Lactococcus garvieae]|uniref:helicase C-terminal domain-containing protein n=1 Tax=Lactococcus garvieae TaxID=1363 RepID=UPI002549F1BC|nr:helicase C-terminal domain-containing protein [Lactococcus garvieae]